MTRRPMLAALCSLVVRLPPSVDEVEEETGQEEQGDNSHLE